MTTLALTDATNGTTADASLVNNNNTALKAVINGGIDNTNVISSAAIAVSKLAPGSSAQVLTTTAGVPVWATDNTKAVLTTTGDTLYASSASTPARLGIGTTGQVLTVAAGLPSWATSTSGDWTSISATLTYSSTDGPTFVCTTSDLTATVAVGARLKLTHSASVKYFIVTAVTSTTITLYGGTDYTISGSAITLPSFSHLKSPLGFPLSAIKWTEQTLNTSDASQGTPSAGTWYNLGSISLSIPIGAWKVYYAAHGLCSASSGTVTDMQTTLSTGSTSQSDDTMTSGFMQQNGAGGTVPAARNAVTKQGTLLLATKTSYYLNAKTRQPNQSNIQFDGSTIATTVIRAVSDYL